MRYSIVLNDEMVSDTSKRDALIDTLRHTQGVLHVDTDIAADGLLFVTGSSILLATDLMVLDGIDRVTVNGAKTIAQPIGG